MPNVASVDFISTGGWFKVKITGVMGHAQVDCGKGDVLEHCLVRLIQGNVRHLYVVVMKSEEASERFQEWPAYRDLCAFVGLEVDAVIGEALVAEASNPLGEPINGFVEQVNG